MEPEQELSELMARVQQHALLVAAAGVATGGIPRPLTRVSIALLWESDAEQWRATATARGGWGADRCLGAAVGGGSLRDAVENLADVLGMYGDERSVEA